MNAIVPFITEARRRFHAALLQYVLRTDAQGVPSNADKHSKISVRIAHAVIEKIGSEALGSRLTGQMSGNQFEEICKAYLEETFMPLKHLRPGQWEISKGVVGGRLGIAHFE